MILPTPSAPSADMAGEFQSEWSDAQRKYSDATAAGIPPTVAERVYLNPVATKWRVSATLLNRQRQLMPKPPTVPKPAATPTPLQAAQLQAQTLKNKKLEQQLASAENIPEYHEAIKKGLAERLVKQIANSESPDPLSDPSIMANRVGFANLLREQQSLQPQAPEAEQPAAPQIQTAKSPEEVANIPQGSTFYAKGVKGLDDGTLYRKDSLSAEQEKMVEDALEGVKKTGRLVIGGGSRLQPSAPATKTVTESMQPIPPAGLTATRDPLLDSPDTDSLVAVINPDGKRVRIKKSQLEDALNQGYKEP